MLSVVCVCVCFDESSTNAGKDRTWRNGGSKGKDIWEKREMRKDEQGRKRREEIGRGGEKKKVLG